MIRALIVAGVFFIGFDVIRLDITGIAVTGAVFWAIAALAAGIHTREFWIRDDPDPNALTSMDERELHRRN